MGVLIDLGGSARTGCGNGPGKYHDETCLLSAAVGGRKHIKERSRRGCGAELFYLCRCLP